MATPSFDAQVLVPRPFGPLSPQASAVVSLYEVEVLDAVY